MPTWRGIYLLLRRLRIIGMHPAGVFLQAGPALHRVILGLCIGKPRLLPSRQMARRELVACNSRFGSDWPVPPTPSLPLAGEGEGGGQSLANSLFRNRMSIPPASVRPDHEGESS